MRYRRRSAVLIALLSLLAVSCTTARINHFKSFADAGVAYTRATQTVLAEAGEAAIDTDTMILEEVRDGLEPGLGRDDNQSPTQRGSTILDHNKLLSERLALLADLGRHARLLQTYFASLGLLAESDAPSGIGAAAEGAVQSMGKLSEGIKKARVGEMPVADFIGSVAEMAVAQFQLSALEGELKQRAGVIERELDLQHAALTAVTEQMRTDLTAQLNKRVFDEVVGPYNSTGSLPSSWGRKRKELLRARVSIASAAAAADAAGQLKLAFVSLVEGRATADDISALIGDLNEIVTLIEEIRGPEEDGQ